MGSWLIKLSISLRKRAGATRGAPANTATAVSAGTNCRRRNGISSPTGTPLRVTTKDCPLSSARMIRPLSLRSSRCVIRRLMPTYCSTCATARALRAEEKQKAGLSNFIGLVDAAVREAKLMLEQVEEDVYFAVELASRFIAACNAVLSSVDINVDEAEHDAVEMSG